MARLVREGAVQVGEQPRLGTPLADDSPAGDAPLGGDAPTNLSA
jgi:hypothetical protein